MGKYGGICAGLLVGALLGAAGMRAYDRSREEGLRSGDDSAASGTGASKGESNPQIEADLAAARQEKAALAARVAELERAAAEAAKTGGSTAKASPWADIGARLYGLRDRIKESEGQNLEEAESLMMELLGYLGKLAQEQGVSLEEAMLSPDGMPSLILSVLGASATPPDAAQAAAIAKILEEGRAGWKDYLARRGDLTKLEQRRDLLALDGQTGGALRGALTADQEALLSDLELFDADMNFGGRSHTGGTREGVATNLTAVWATELKLEDSQRPALRLIVDEYMRDKEALAQDWAQRKAAGQTVTDRQVASESVEAMIRAQKRISETMRLTEEQVKAVRAWGTTYEYSLTE